MLGISKSAIFTSEKIISIMSAKSKILEIRKDGKTAGLCHGGFDLLHPGHIRHFESAKKLCNFLFVSVTSDRFVSKLKGKGRPVFSQNLRAYSVACLESVDYAVVSDFKTGVEAIKILRPSYYIKGPDYANKDDPALKKEINAVKSAGGNIKFTDDAKFSTSEVISYIKNNLN